MAPERGRALEEIENEEDGPGRVYFHGTDVDSALALLNGAPLSFETAQNNKTDYSQIGFYMANSPEISSYFASRHDRGAIVQISMTAGAYSLLRPNMVEQLIPQFRVPGARETIILPTGFPTFNMLRSVGKIFLTPSSVS